MAVSLDYVARETASNLWRNRLMTIAAVLTVAVSLSLVGTSLLLKQGVAHATTQWQHGVSVEAFLDPPASVRCVLNNPNEAQAIVKQFHGFPGVKAVTTPAQAIRNMESLAKILRWV